MIQPSDPLAVWYFSNAQAEYIVAAPGSTGASQAFARVAVCRGQLPQRYPELESNFSGRSLAISNPGIIYRRKLARPPVNQPR